MIALERKFIRKVTSKKVYQHCKSITKCNSYNVTSQKASHHTNQHVNDKVILKSLPKS